MIITIGGPIGSGKSTVAEAVAKRFGLVHVSAGAIFRQMAEERGLSLQEFSKIAEKDHSFDREIDDRQMKLVKKGNAVVDGRLSGRFIDGDLKIWLTAPADLRAQRVSKREDKTFKDAKEEMEKREKSEAARYKNIYDINLYDLSDYDVVLNTAHWDAAGVIKIIEKLIEVKL